MAAEYSQAGFHEGLSGAGDLGNFWQETVWRERGNCEAVVLRAASQTRHPRAYRIDGRV